MKKGFSIIEGIVAMVILGLVSYAFVQFLGDAVRGQKHVQNAVDFDILKTSLNLVFNSRACDNALRIDATGNAVQITLPAGTTWATLAPGTNVVTTPIQLHEIKLGTSALITKNQALGGGLTTSALEITNAVYDGTQSISDAGGPPINYHAFIATVHFAASKPQGTPGVSTLSKDMSLRLLTNYTTGLVEKCGLPPQSGGWQEVSLADVADFDTQCQYQVKMQTSDTTNHNLLNGDLSWRNAIIRSEKYLGLMFTDATGYAVWGIPSTAKNSYGYRNSSGTYSPQSSVVVLKIQKNCSP